MGQLDFPALHIAAIDLEMLRETLEDDSRSPWVRAVAADALASLKDIEAGPIASRVVEHEDDREHRNDGHHPLNDVEVRGHSVDDLAERLVDLRFWIRLGQVGIRSLSAVLDALAPAQQQEQHRDEREHEVEADAGGEEEAAVRLEGARDLERGATPPAAGTARARESFDPQPS